MERDTVRVTFACGHEGETDADFALAAQAQKCPACAQDADKAFRESLKIVEAADHDFDGMSVRVIRTAGGADLYGFVGDYRPGVGEEIDYTRCPQPAYGRTLEELRAYFHADEE